MLSSVSWMALLNPLMYAQEQDTEKVRSRHAWEWICCSKVVLIAMVTGSFGFLGEIACFFSSVVNTGALFLPFQVAGGFAILLSVV